MHSSQRVNEDQANMATSLSFERLTRRVRLVCLPETRIGSEVRQDRHGTRVNIKFEGSFNLYFQRKISRFKLYILGSDMVYMIHI